MATGHSPHTDIEPKRRDFNTNSGFIETPSASRRSSQAYAIVLSLSDPIYVSPEDKEDGDSPARHNGSEDVHVNEMKILPRPASRAQSDPSWLYTSPATQEAQRVSLRSEHRWKRRAS